MNSIIFLEGCIMKQATNSTVATSVNSDSQDRGNALYHQLQQNRVLLLLSDEGNGPFHEHDVLKEFRRLQRLDYQGDLVVQDYLAVSHKKHIDSISRAWDLHPHGRRSKNGLLLRVASIVMPVSYEIKIFKSIMSFMKHSVNSYAQNAVLRFLCGADPYILTMSSEEDEIFWTMFQSTMLENGRLSDGVTLNRIRMPIETFVRDVDKRDSNFGYYYHFSNTNIVPNQ
jgi:hypothetical protein